jgi:hypothetical protein
MLVEAAEQWRHFLSDMVAGGGGSRWLFDVVLWLCLMVGARWVCVEVVDRLGAKRESVIVSIDRWLGGVHVGVK